MLTAGVVEGGGGDVVPEDIPHSRMGQVVVVVRDHMIIEPAAAVVHHAYHVRSQRDAPKVVQRLHRDDIVVQVDESKQAREQRGDVEAGVVRSCREILPFRFADLPVSIHPTTREIRHECSP